MLRLRIEHLWLSLPAALLVWRGFLQPVRLLDFWWHLKAGEVIVTTGSIPRANIFSFTASELPSVPHCWLAEAIYYVEYGVGSLPLMIVLNTALLIAALLPVYHMCLEGCGNIRLAVVAAMLPALSLGIFSGMRPHVLSFALLAIFYWVLDNYRRRQRDVLWALPPLMALWVNLHGAFVVGLGLLALYWCCEAARRWVPGPEAAVLSSRELTKLTIILLLAALATLLNPEAYKIYAFLRDFGINKYDFVTEWQVPRINSLEGLLIFHGPFFFALLVLLYSRRQLDLTDLALFLGFSAFGLTAYRNGVWFGLIAAPIVGRHLPTLGGWDGLSSLRRFPPVDALARWLSHLHQRPAAIPRHGLNAAIAAMMLAITVVLSPWVYPHVDVERLRAGLLERETPIGAMDYIEQHGLEGHTFHPQLYGDYLIWRLWPRQQSFFDSQVHLFSESVFQDYALVFHDAHWQERLAPYDIAFLLLRKSAEDNQLMIEDARQSPDWSLLYEDDLSVLFKRVQ